MARSVSRVAARGFQGSVFLGRPTMWPPHIGPQCRLQWCSEGWGGRGPQNDGKMGVITAKMKKVIRGNHASHDFWGRQNYCSPPRAPILHGTPLDCGVETFHNRF